MTALNGKQIVQKNHNETKIADKILKTIIFIERN